MDSDQREVLDADQVEDLRGVDDGRMLAKIVGMYLSKTPQRILLLRTHFAAGDFAAIAREAHTLKGASGSIGASRVADTCTKIEKAGKAQDAKPLDELMQILEVEFARARDALQAMTGPGKP
jgi:HPt (histidine-containing phosphotransfer) domain-containing protein